MHKEEEEEEHKWYLPQESVSFVLLSRKSFILRMSVDTSTPFPFPFPLPQIQIECAECVHLSTISIKLNQINLCVWCTRLRPTKFALNGMEWGGGRKTTNTYHLAIELLNIYAILDYSPSNGKRKKKPRKN